MSVDTEADCRRPVVIDAEAEDDSEPDDGFEPNDHVARQPIDRLIELRARCYDPRGSYNALFYSDDRLDIARAKAICSRCTVREWCLTRAMDRREPYGVWGGETLLDGEIVAVRRRPGRPRTDATPVFVDEISGLECVPLADAV